MKQCVWILNHYAVMPDLPGGTRHFDLGCELANMGYQVTILASAFNHSLKKEVRLVDGESWRAEEVDGVRFVWLPAFAYETNDWRRMANMLDYTWRAYAWGRHLPRLEPRISPPEVVIGCTVHPFAVLAGYRLARHYRAHFVMEVRDLWPQSLVDMGLWREGQLPVRVFRWLERFSYARAERIITLSPLTREYLAGYSEQWPDKVVYVPNGTRVARFARDSSGDRPAHRPLQAIYFGSMGSKNGLDLILRAMRILDESEPGLLECTLVGDGPERPRLEQMVREWRLEAVRFDGPVPRAQIPSIAAQADLLVLVEREVLYGSSNKLFDYMASGKPIVASVFAKHNNLVHEAECGLAAAPDNAEDLAQKLLSAARMPEAERQAMGNRGRAYVREHFDYSVLARRLAELLEGL